MIVFPSFMLEKNSNPKTEKNLFTYCSSKSSVKSKIERSRGLCFNLDEKTVTRTRRFKRKKLCYPLHSLRLRELKVCLQVNNFLSLDVTSKTTEFDLYFSVGAIAAVNIGSQEKER